MGTWFGSCTLSVRDRAVWEEKMMLDVLQSIGAWFGALFARKDDNYKALLIADLGIER